MLRLYLISDLFQSVTYQLKSVLSTQLRKILLFLIIVLFIFSLSQSAFSIYLAAIFYDENNTSSILQYLSPSIVGICLMIICSVGLRGAVILNLELLLAFFWGVMIFLAPLIIGAVSCFNLYSYISSFFYHQWDTVSFKLVRDMFCKDGTASNKCVQPLHAQPNYCMTLYNATDCLHIRADAIEEAIAWGTSLTVIQAAAIVAVLSVILLAIYVCFKMLTPSIITESMNDVINYLLVLPIVGCAVMAWYMWSWRKYTTLPYAWAPPMFAATAALQFVALPFGVAAGRLKSNLMLDTYILITFALMASLVVLGVYALVYAALIPNTYQPSTAETSYIACDKGLYGCCCCLSQRNSSFTRNPANLCPEWNTNDVVSLLQLDLKLAAAVALTSIMYLAGAVTVALIVRIGLKNYKSDYV